MTNERADSDNLLTLPPIPLATGDVVAFDDGADVRRISGISLHVATSDGGTTVLVLDRRFAGWVGTWGRILSGWHAVG